jgi:hypothetical protein
MNRKNRFVDTEQWRSNRKFAEMKGWGQLLHLYLYLDRADFAGIAHLNLKAFELFSNTKAFSKEEIENAPENIRSQLMPDDMKVIAEELKEFWVHYGEGIFICKHFLIKTQAKQLRLSNPPHGAIIKDMARWFTDGMEDVFVEVMNANTTARFVPLQECYNDLVGSLKNAEAEADIKKKQSKIEGAKGRLGNFEDVVFFLRMITPINSLPEFKLDSDEKKSLGADNTNISLENKTGEVEEDDPLRPNKHPDQSKPLCSFTSQESHDKWLSMDK